MVVINSAAQLPAHAAGLPIPEPVGPDEDVPGLGRAIADTRGFLAHLDPALINAREDQPLCYRIDHHLEATLPTAQWLTVFAATNIYFHISTAYGILRAHRVPLGKADMIAAGL